MSEGIERIGLALQPLVGALRARLRAAPVLHADETPVAQLDPGACKAKRAYLFTYRTTDPLLKAGDIASTLKVQSKSPIPSRLFQDAAGESSCCGS